MSTMSRKPGTSVGAPKRVKRKVRIIDSHTHPFGNASIDLSQDYAKVMKRLADELELRSKR